MGFVEVVTELEPIESSIQLSLSKAPSTDKNIQRRSKKIIRCLTNSLQDQKESTNISIVNENKSHSSSKNLKRISRIIGKRGTRDTEFNHPSSLAYSKRDKLICKIKLKRIFIMNDI